MEMGKTGSDAIAAFKEYIKSIGPDRLPNEFWSYVADMVVVNPQLTTQLFVAMLKGEMTPADTLYRLCAWFAEAFKDGAKDASKEDQIRYKLAAVRVSDFITIMNKTA